MTFFDGTGSQTNTNRWGDYTSMMVDPEDDCTFWYLNQYIAVSGSFAWRTRFGYFFLDGCDSSMV